MQMDVLAVVCLVSLGTSPVVVARQKGAMLAHPYLFEPRPGVLWVTTWNSLKQRDGRWVAILPVCLELREADFVSE